MEKKYFCYIRFEYASKFAHRYAWGGKTYQDALEIGKEYQRKHSKVIDVDVIGYCLSTDTSLYDPTKFIN